MKRVLITGSSGLVGSEAVIYFGKLGWHVLGVDNNLRADFFGPEGDTTWNLKLLKENIPEFTHLDLDIRHRQKVLELFKDHKVNLIIHCAAQPSHDLAASKPFDDWDVNATGTINLLEATRRHCAEAPFIVMSTNKVYGDAPNRLPLVELHTRYDYAEPEDYDGIDETCAIDGVLHSLFGASKAAADMVAQEYGRYFGMPIGIFRAGCVTGPRHSGVPLHGFLSYLVKAVVHGKPYTIYGYKGKQVRDNIHSHDLVRLFNEFYQNPTSGEAFNAGGGRANSVSVLEAIEKVEQMTGRKMIRSYCDQARRGDHICYISNLRKIKTCFPKWDCTRSLDDILAEIVAFEMSRVVN